jgi:hypothetical protein
LVVADADGEAVGFVAARSHHATGIGEVYMIAVDRALPAIRFFKALSD